MRVRHLSWTILLIGAALHVSAPALATCKPYDVSKLSDERLEADRDLAEQARLREAAHVDLKLKNKAYEAATTELSQNPDGGDTAVKAAAEALDKARRTKEKSDESWKDAQRKLDCIVGQIEWSWSLAFPGKVAGSAGGRWLLGVGARLGLRSSPRESHYIEADYISLNGFGFNESAYDAAGMSQRVALVSYAYRYKNISLGPGAAVRVSERGNHGDMIHPNGWLVSHIALNFDNPTLPGICSNMCLITGGRVFVEPWFPLDEEVPVNVLVGAEFSIGLGVGR